MGSPLSLRSAEMQLLEPLQDHSLIHTMRTRTFFLVVALLLAVSGPAQGQTDVRHVDLEIEPLAYTFGGAGGHVALQNGAWKYEIEVFGLEIPQSLHGNTRFTARPTGFELHFERFFGERVGGFYLGPEVGLVRLRLNHSPSGRTEYRTRYSVGLRGGYQWYTGLGNIYVSPVVGLSYTLNGEAIEIGGDTFESAPLGPWGTVGLGWSFGR